MLNKTLQSYEASNQQKKDAEYINVIKYQES